MAVMQLPAERAKPSGNWPGSRHARLTTHVGLRSGVCVQCATRLGRVHEKVRVCDLRALDLRGRGDL
eukprot:scaffold77621_cov65-Phaeocystis_antarctica.AAC.3